MEGYLNVTKAAQFAGISRSQMHRWINNGLPTHSISAKCRLVKKSDLVDWIERKPGRPNTRRKYR